MPQIRKLAYAIKNSSTIALPQWYRILENLSLDARVIPCDVCTRWNATYDMLDVAYQYKKAINKITDMWDMKLCAYEIETHEWKVVRQLRDLLKVSDCLFCTICSTHHPSLRFLMTQHYSSHVAAHLA